MRPGFPKCGACELIFASERPVLWTEICKFGGLRAKIWAKFEAVEAKISKFFPKGGLVNCSFAVAASRGGGMGGKCPLVGGSAPTCPPPVRRKKWLKSAIFGKFLDFLPPQNRILPPQCPPHKNFWCRHCSFAWNGTLTSYGRGVKRGSSRMHIPIPLFRLEPPPRYNFLRGYNWMPSAHSVLLPWIQTKLSWKPEIVFN